MNRTLLSVLVAAAAASLVAQENPQPRPVTPVEGKPIAVKQAEAKPFPVQPVPGQPGQGQPGKGNAWFPVVEKDLGTYFNHEEAVGRFDFKNPTANPVDWKNLTASCQCSRVVITIGDRRYELSKSPTPNTLVRLTKGKDGSSGERVSQIEIGPNESGEAEVHMDMAGITGPKQASLLIHTTDPETPMINLQWHATGAQLFLVSPADVNLNQMVWNEKRDFTVTVTSPVAKDFNITRMENANDFQVKYEKAMKDDVATWTITGTYGPVQNEVGGGGVLKFYTDLKGEPNFLVRVSAMVKGPLEIKPGTFLTLGMIRHGTTKTEKIVFEPNDGTDLEAADIRFEKLSIDPKFMLTRKSKDGTKLVIEMEVSKDAPTGLLRGSLIVDLNHPAIKTKTILFNGFVR